MTVLITGGSGFLGRRAAERFRRLGWRVLTPSHPQLDITDRAAVLARLAADRPAFVLHCAAVSDTAACARDPAGTARINVEGSRNLAEGCAETGAKLILCSSDQVYSGTPGPHRETEVLTPNNVYGAQKLRAEQLCQSCCPDTVSLRLSWMYDRISLPGEHGNFMSTLLPALKDPERPLCWPVYDRRGITDVGTVVENLEKALFLPAGIYNFGSENDGNTYDTVRACLEELELTQALGRLRPNREAFSGSPRDIRMDMGKAARAGISFPTTRQGLLRVLKQEA